MANGNKTTGRLGEDLAAKFLIGKGAMIIGRNFQTRYGEIDLIVHLNNEILFCEVKTRTGTDFGYPETAVNRGKVEKMTKAACAYLAENKINVSWRLDIVAIQLDEIKKEARIKWFKNISSNL